MFEERKMKKAIISILLLALSLGCVYATEVNIESRTGLGYIGKWPSDIESINCFDMVIGTDVYCLESGLFEVGFNGQWLFGVCNTSTQTQYSKQAYSYTNGFSLFYIGPVVRFNITDKFSARVSMGYIDSFRESTAGFEFSGDYLVSDKWAVGLELKYAVRSYIDVNAIATYKF